METNHSPKETLPPIPAKRYFTIGEVSELCGVKPHVLRYWEQEFTQLKPVKRRGNRRYYQHHEVLLIRRIPPISFMTRGSPSAARATGWPHEIVTEPAKTSSSRWRPARQISRCCARK